MKDYLVTTKDLKAIEEGIGYVWNQKLDFVFGDKQKVKNVVVISYDSNFLYIYKYKDNPVNIINATRLTTALESYDLFKVPHKIKIDKNDLLGWVAGFLLNDRLSSDKIFSFPNEGDKIYFQIISGSLVSKFLIEQKKKTKHMPLNPYTTFESYLATIVHEFGHAYYNNFHTWWYSNITENLEYLNCALELYKNKKINNLPKINIPNYDKRLILLSELFAFCTDYSAALIFWKEHIKDIDRANILELKNLIKVEKKKDLLKENSVLDPDPSGHIVAMTIGKVLIDQFPKSWPGKILRANKLIL
ncbi:MAG: hypothetical protein Q7S14_01940 [bacterium]|nr:hypothetical protein [bacterium]